MRLNDVLTGIQSDAQTDALPASRFDGVAARRAGAGADLPPAARARRRCLAALAVCGLGGGLLPVARGAVRLTDAEAGSGLRAALQRGAALAVDSLGRAEGFSGNPQVRIGLPDWLEQPARLLRLSGLGGQIDELVATMNRAAEAAVPAARPVLMEAVAALNIVDARNILTGGDQAVTQFFADKTHTPLAEKFLPIVTRATQRLDLAGKVNHLLGQASAAGLVRRDAANLEQYVTGKTLDGLFLVIGEEERRIRADPVGTGSAVLKKVFGALR